METALGTIAIILLFVAIPCLILGLIQPKIFSRFFKSNLNRKKTSLVFGLAIICSLMIIGIFSAGTPTLAKMKNPTNQKDLTVSGSTSFKVAAIRVFQNGETAKELTASDKGNFSTVIELREGLNKIKVSATNEKNKTKSSSELKIIYDITPPEFSFDQPSGPIQSDKLSFKGKSEKNAQIIISLADKEIKRVKVRRDSFEIKNILLNEGENKFTVKAIDEADNYSQPREFTITYQKPKEEPKKTNPPSQTPTARPSTPTPTPIPTTTPIPAKTITPKVEQTVDTMDQLWKAVDAGLGTRKDIDIKYDTGSKLVTIIRKGDMLDDNSFVRDGFSTLVKYGREVFKVNGVECIWIDLKTIFVDSYGNESSQTGMDIQMTKENFLKFNWDNLKYTPVRSQIENASQYFFIHGVIQKKLNNNKLYLTF